MNLKNGKPKGSLLKGILDNPVKRQGIWNTLDEQLKLFQVSPVAMDNETPELKRIKANMVKIRYVKYALLFFTILIALTVAILNQNGFSI